MLKKIAVTKAPAAALFIRLAAGLIFFTQGILKYTDPHMGVLRFARIGLKRSSIIIPTLLAMGILAGCTTSRPDAMKNEQGSNETESYFLPNAQASQVVSVTNAGPAVANILVQTHAVAVKETGPKETVAHFGEVYAFSPAFIAVHRDEPTRIRFWNLQPDDKHDFMLVDPHMNVLMKVLLPPLHETSYVFTFHEEGLFYFYCAMHQPPMSGQILVLLPRAP